MSESCETLAAPDSDLKITKTVESHLAGFGPHVIRFLGDGRITPGSNQVDSFSPE